MLGSTYYVHTEQRNYMSGLLVWDSAIDLNFVMRYFVCNHLDGEKELVALLSLCFWCLVTVVWLFLVVL